ncbi:MAG: glycosyltransferase family 1 protein [Candidatus Paceibacterota bacterium]|jgi:glycosyltransferase involved in cell wall biosynthesis
MKESKETKIRVALMSDVIDRRPERTKVGRYLAEYLLSRPEIELYLIHYDKMPDDPLYDRVHEVIIPRVNFIFGSKFLSFIKFCLTTNLRFDIVHWLVARPYPFFWFFPSKKFVVTAHDGGSILAPGMFTLPNFFFNLTMRWFNGHIDAVTGASEFGSRQIVYAYHIHPEKVFTAYVAQDPIYRPLPREEVDLVLNRYNLFFQEYFLYVGGLQTHKNVGAVVGGYDIYRDFELGIEKLVLISNPSYDAPKVFEKIKKAKHGGDVIHFKYVDIKDMPAIYNGAKALVFTSLNEGFGLPLAEAMACGVPIVASRRSVIAEVTDGAAVFVDPLSDESVANGIRKVSQDKKLRDDLIKKGLTRAAYFSWEKFGEAVVSMYDRILQS